MSADVLERPIPLQENPEEMLKLRDEMKEIVYTKAVLEREGKNLPKTAKELQERWDQQVKEAAEKSEQGKEEEKGKVPDIVLKDLDEDDRTWTETLGWPKEKREQVKEALKEVLGLDKNEIEHTFECIIASGRAPEDVLSLLKTEQYDAKYRKVVEDYHLENVGEEERQLATKALFIEDILGGLSNKVRYIKRFILHKDFEDRSLYFLRGHGGLSDMEGYAMSLNDEFKGKLPDNLFDLAWNIGWEKQGRYGIDGLFPVLRMQVARVKEKDEEGNIKKDSTGKDIEKVKGRYVVDQANIMEWMREQIWQWYEDQDTDEVTNYFEKVKVDKGSFYSINLITMLFNKQLYFSDETKHYWGGLWNQVLFEPWMMFFMRTYYLEYEKAMGSEEKLAETFNNTFFLSKFTRKLDGLSMIGKLSSLALNYEGKNSDTKLGEGFQEMFMVYYYMSDYEMLLKLIGKDSPFFTRQFWVDAINDVAAEDLDATGMPKMTHYLGDKMNDFLEAFSQDGKSIKDPKKFISFLNYFPVPVPSSTWVQVVDKGIKNLVKDKFEYMDKKTGKTEVKTFDLNYAWLIAHSWKFITGAAAKNNYPAVSGHNAETKWRFPREYRKKYADNYAGGGNPFTIMMFKQLGIPLLEGVHLENAFAPVIISYDADGNPIFADQIDKKNPAYREMVPMEILLKMRLLSQEYGGRIAAQKQKIKDAPNDQERKRQEMELVRLEDEEKNKYKLLASKLVFKGDAMRNYAQNIIGRTKVLFEQLMGGQEIDFEKFSKYDGIFRGVSFNRAEWQKSLQGSLVTPLRYLFEANGATQLNMLVRAPNENNEWEEMSLGEAMIGHQLIDIPEFRMRREDVTDEEWKIRKRMGYRMRGRYMVRPDGRHEINSNRMQANKRLAWQQWMLGKLAGDLHQHISNHSTDPAYGMSHVLDIIDAIEKLPAHLGATETDMQGARFEKGFFSKEQIEMLKRLAGASTTRLFNREFWMSLFGGKHKKESLFGESASIFLSSIFRGYGN